MKVDEPGEAKIREYEAVVELVSRTNSHLDQAVVDKIEQLIQELDSPDDPIFQVNCLQLIADLACSPKALALLEERQVPQKLIAILNESDPLTVPHALKLFYRINPSDLETKYPQVLSKICDYLESDDSRLVDHAVDIIAAIGRGGYSARKVLADHEGFKEKCLPRLGRTIICSESLLKSRTLRCICDLLEAHEDEDIPKEQSSKLCEDFYHSIIEGEMRMTNQLLALCRVPFMEIRINAMLVVAVIAGQVWGQRELAAHPQFVKWILDRSTEACKDGKEAKFEILKTLVKSSTTSRHFKGEDYLKMRADFKNGPFHVGIAEEMMLDNKSAG